jgi:hypothetical protein
MKRWKLMWSFLTFGSKEASLGSSSKELSRSSAKAVQLRPTVSKIFIYTWMKKKKKKKERTRTRRTRTRKIEKNI